MIFKVFIEYIHIFIWNSEWGGGLAFVTSPGLHLPYLRPWLLGDKIKDHETSEAFGTNGTREKLRVILVENLKSRAHLGDLSIEQRTVLQRILNK
jgi:hypothetical protein